MMSSAQLERAELSMQSGQLPPTKQHYLVLDGLRGVAAIGVMLFHRRWWAPGGHFLDHAYLAVDFFFLLSGFVIAHAYERRLTQGMAFTAFMRLRVIRLYPLIILGSLLGGLYWVLNAADKPIGQGWIDIALLTCVSMFALPAIPQLSTEPFPLNRPTWSLCNEILVNLFYGLIARVLGMRLLIMIIVVSLVAESAALLHVGSLRTIGAQFDTLLYGVPRTTFPFFLGVLIYRLHRQNRLPHLNIGLVGLTVLLLISFVPAEFKTYESGYEAFCITLLYPAIIIAGCGHQLRNATARAATVLANLSFPLYVLHYPLYDLLTTAATALGYTEGRPRPWYLLVTSALVLVLSLIAMYRYDIPVRRWLSRRYPLQSTTSIKVRAVEARS